MIKRYPTQCEALFLAQGQKKLTAIQLFDLFSPYYSPDGSNAREREVEIMYYWMNFLEECEGTRTIMDDITV